MQVLQHRKQVRERMNKKSARDSRHLPSPKGAAPTNKGHVAMLGSQLRITAVSPYVMVCFVALEPCSTPQNQGGQGAVRVDVLGSMGQQNHLAESLPRPS